MPGAMKSYVTMTRKLSLLNWQTNNNSDDLTVTFIKSRRHLIGSQPGVLARASKIKTSEGYST